MVWSATQPLVSVIIPTFNEAENLGTLLDALGEVLNELVYELIVVDDDSPDRTWELAANYAQRDARVRLLHRIERRGLSSAVFDGMTTARGQIFVVLDADLQHDERIIPHLLQPILDGTTSVTVGSRAVSGGGYGNFSPPRRVISWSGAVLARRLLKVQVGDPMSGFFAISKERFDEVKRDINPRGFKILLEFLARRPRPRPVEVGYEFRNRRSGETKLTTNVILAYLFTVVELTIGRIFSARFSAYALVGAVGAGLRSAVYVVTTAIADGLLPDATTGMASAVTAFVAIEASVVWNYWANNTFTFAPYRHEGRPAYAKGLARFHIVAAHGLVLSAGLGSILGLPSDSALFGSWPELPLLTFVAVIAGATVSNYVLNALFTWRAWH